MVDRIGNHTFDDHADDMWVDGGAVAAEVGDCNSADRTISLERDDDAAAADAAADAAEDALTGYDAAWVAVAD